MKKICIILIFVSVANTVLAQIPNTFYGLARKNTPTPQLFLSTINPSTGLVSNISPSSLGPMVNLTSAALNPNTNTFHYVGGNVFKSIDLVTGTIVNTVLINNPIANSTFENFRFNNADSSIYGLARRVIFDSVNNTYLNEVFLATIQPGNGLVTQISPNSVGLGFALAGSAIDPHLNVFYYSTGLNLIGLDMFNGTVYSNAPITLSNGIVFDNFTYSCVDTALYGLVRQNYYDSLPDPLWPNGWNVFVDSTSIHLAKINPNTGLVTTISPTSLDQGGYSLNSGSTIDPSTKTFYYNNGLQIIGVSMITGLKVTQQTLINSNGELFELMRIQSNCFRAANTRTNPSLGFDENTVHKKVELFPNPTASVFVIHADENIESVQVYNSGMSLVYYTEPKAKSIAIELDNFPTGLYMVKIQSGNTILVKKVVKEE
jgi:hypothetical protein